MKRKVWLSVLREMSTGKRRLSEQGNQIGMELQQGVQKSYKDIIDVSWGDAHALGMKPISFVRQVIAACLYPELLQSDRIPIDARLRAQRLLRVCDGGSVDGGVPSSPENIFICSGSQSALMFILKLLSSGEGPSQMGVLNPMPTYPSFTLALEVQGVAMVPYYLCEEEGWALKIEELHRVLQNTKGHCSPRVLYIINPGNPTGHVQSRESIEEVIRFAAEEKLFLLADEVYQGSVHVEAMEFVSYKKVLSEMGPGYSDTVQLASFHSVSKGFMGECGLRGGYMELVNLDPEVMDVVRTLFSLSTCTAVTGQFALDIMVDPPQPGDPSYPTYSEEARSMAGMEADLLYCTRLLEEAGVCVGPGCEYGQQEGTHHLRMCVMTPTENLEELLRRLKTFHLSFLSEFS
ncbi:hypothetical protein AAFF_G00132130 [Aldrovandia affinis]|uniref:alanine transaminase n=1 Tax=Aldrovandia affinis TaxID=143900 RepID=A0AAD7R0X6_9TELE|nr:hypothetical protein AAFF_G00132130 [Aldrovandia affinis]